jgi:hypothetical protein
MECGSGFRIRIQGERKEENKEKKCSTVEYL